MHPQLNYYTMVRDRAAEVQRAAERARLAAQVPAKRRSLREKKTITRPSDEPWRGTPALEVERAIGGAS